LLFSYLSYAVDFLFDCERIYTREWQIKEKNNSLVKHDEGIVILTCRENEMDLEIRQLTPRSVACVGRCPVHVDATTTMCMAAFVANAKS